MNSELKVYDDKKKQAIQRLCQLIMPKQKITKPTFQELIVSSSRRIQRNSELHLLFNSINEKLNIERVKETCRTLAECKFQEYFEDVTKVSIATQIWVGNYCVDFITTSLGVRKKDYLRGFLQKGVVFEVDGSSHDHPVKQKKDALRDEFFLSIGILPLRIVNEKVSHSHIQALCSQLAQISTPDRRRLNDKMALATCAYNASDDQWHSLVDSIFSKKGKHHDKQ
ncbi:MAG: endonuclease domain-containing protein [Pseudobdellovibrio sp.]|nr:endonuclease domain-containing protein [Pseudobdellovibrio sp.]